jgi:hypothetical protein
MFASNDWVARAANLAVSSPESRAVFVKDVRSKSASLPREQKAWYAQADWRSWALQDPILDHSDLRAEAVNIVRCYGTPSRRCS